MTSTEGELPLSLILSIAELPSQSGGADFYQYHNDGDAGSVSESELTIFASITTTFKQSEAELCDGCYSGQVEVRT